jgi:hypothetical protein
MLARDRERYHQLHPAKLVADWGTAIVAGGLLWWRHPIGALVVGFVPSILISWIFLSGRFDRSLDAIRDGSAARTIAPHLSAGVNAIRFAGLALAWAGCWLHAAWMLPAGVFVILAGWWIAWRRGAEER